MMALPMKHGRSSDHTSDDATVGDDHHDFLIELEVAAQRMDDANKALQRLVRSLREERDARRNRSSGP